MYIKFKRILALVMTLTMLFTAFQTTAFAQDDNSFTVEAVNDDENTNEKSSETENLEQETSEATNAQTPEQSVEQTPEQSVEQTPVVEEPVIEGDVLEGDVLEPEVLPNLAPSSDLSQGTETGENLENVNLNNMTLHWVPEVNPNRNVDDDLEVVLECDTNENHKHVCEDHPHEIYDRKLDNVIPKQVMEGPFNEYGRWTVYLGFTDSQISEFGKIAKEVWGVEHSVTPEEFFTNLRIKYVWDYDDWEWDLADRSLVDYHKDYHDDDDHDDNDDLVIRYTCNPVKPDKPSILEDVNVILRCLTKDDVTNHTDINRFDGVLTKATFYEEQISDVSYNEKEQKWEVVATFDDYQIRNFKKIADNVWQMEHTFEGNREITFQYDEKTGTWTAVGSQTKDGEIILDYTHIAIEPEKEYKITFYPGDNGTISGETQTTVVDGNKINWVPEAEPNEGWIFIGWKDDNGNTYTSEDVKNVVPTTDMNFTAQYEKDEPIVPGNNVDEIRVVISGDLKNQIKDTFGELISVVHLNERGGDGKTDYLMLTTPNAGGYYREYAPKGLTLENWTEYYESIIPISTLVWEENPCYGTNPMDEHIVDVKYTKERQWNDIFGLKDKIDVLTIYLDVPEEPPVEPEYTDITVEKTVNGIDTKDIGSFEFVLTDVETGEETEFTINEFTENKATTVIPKLVVGKTYTISEKADSTVRDGYEFKGVSVNGNVLSEENGRYSYTFIAGETVTVSFDNTYEMIPKSPVDEIRVVISGDLKDQINDKFLEFISVVHLNERGGDGENDYLRLITLNFGEYYKAKAPEGLTLENWTEYYESVIPVSSMLWEENPCYGTDPMDEHIVDVKYTEENGLCGKTNILTIYLGVPDDENPENPENPIDVSGIKVYNMIADANGITLKENPTDVVFNFRIDKLNAEGGTEATVGEGTNKDGGKVEFTSYVEKLADGDYRVLEVVTAPEDENWIYDTTIYNFTVKDGKASVQAGINFVNKLKDKEPENPIEASGIKVYNMISDANGITLKENPTDVVFNFRIAKLNAEGKTEAIVGEGTNKDGGKVEFTSYVEKLADGDYRVLEVVTAPEDENWIYDTTIYNFTVKDGKASVQAGINFVNKLKDKEPENPIEASGIKVYNMISDANGITLKENPTDVVFNFRIAKLNAEGKTEAIVGEGTNKDGGKVEFTSYVEKLADGNYRVVEVIPGLEDENWIYDTTIYNFTVKDGKASVQAGMNFVNKLKDKEPENPIDAAGIKVYNMITDANGITLEKNPTDVVFNFRIAKLNAEGKTEAIVGEGTNKDGGKVEFTSYVEKLADGDYRVLEVVTAPEDENWIYDTTIYNFTVKDGKASVQAGINFVNKLKDDSPVIGGDIKVVFNKGNAGNIENFPDGSVAVVVDKGTKLETKDVPNIIPDTNYRFVGWKDDATGTIYTSETILEIVVENNISFTAQYEYTGGSSSGGGGGSSGGGRTIEDEDVPLANLNLEDHFGYVVGYPDGTVRPNDYITREEVATIFFRLIDDYSREEYWSTTNSYTDTVPTDWSNNAISTLEKSNIISGYPDGTFRGDNYITRAEFAVISARFDETPYVGDDLFTDISGHWAQEYINRAGNRGWLHGYSDGTFAPNKYITRAEAFTLINAVLGRTPNNESLCDGMVTFSDNPKGTWYYAQIQEATNSHNVAEPVEGETNEVWTEVIPMRDWKAIEQPSNKTFIPDPYAPEIPDLSEVTE